MIQKPSRDDVTRTPLKVDSPALPGAREGNSTSLQGREGIGRARSGLPLADHDGPGVGPGIEPGGIGGLTTMVGGQHQVNRRVRWRQGGKLDEAELIEVAGEQEMTAGVPDVEHQAAGV